MKIIIAPDKFKGSLTAIEVCNAVEKGIHKVDPTIQVIKHPLADGGEGTLEILQNYFNLKKVTTQVQNPVFKLISKDTAYIEMSHASGLQLLKKSAQNCFYTTTYGTGELIANAINKGFKNIVLFIGGSATNDAGIGMANALGYSFYDKNGDILKPIGKELINIAKIDDSNVTVNLKKVKFTVVCDVKNVLFGKQGAAYMYGKQKGASDKEIELLDNGLKNFSKKVSKYLSKDISAIKGGGAAGGLGAGAVSFLNANIQSGIDFVFNQTNFHQYFKHKIDLIITGEGSVDKQTLEGKVVKGVSDLANKNNIPLAIISGKIEDNNLIHQNLKPTYIYSIMDLKISFKDAIQNASKYVSLIAENIAKNLNFNKL